jgi:hypothetical protein
MAKLIRLLVIGVVAAVAASCGNVVRSSRSPVLLNVNSVLGFSGKSSGGGAGSSVLPSDVLTNVTSPAPCSTTSPCPTVFTDTGQAVLAGLMKDVTVSPTTNNQITITSYHVAYRRTDGRNVPGVDVPYAFDGAATMTVPAGGTATIGFDLVRAAAKEEAPLVQLVNSANVITAIADVTFFGTDAVGNEVSATGSIQIDFANFGD